MKFLSEDEKSPPVYSVGPILHVDSGDEQNPKYGEIMKWLDEQPDSSVVFLCFGSKGYFDEVQVKEIAMALETSGHRFLWSLRKPPGENRLETPGEYENPSEILPEGFIERTLSSGKVIGWAQQVAVLSHRAVGGFVSHYGWNTTLEIDECFSAGEGFGSGGGVIETKPLLRKIDGAIRVRSNVDPTFDSLVGSGRSRGTTATPLFSRIHTSLINMEYKKSSNDANMIVRADAIENEIRRLMEPVSDKRVKWRS
ncbi:hypothetical protein CASFOL_022613 [Castilleja foliolosa]|uniref:Uncharacterized protein ycf68 n=1 Tax=Castilleja foliolosa TaxID=1961234 RepID=A0ABD3CYE4_9LAMI